MTAPSATIALIKAHCDAHERSGRAQFSVAGIRLLLDHIASLEAENARLVKEAAAQFKRDGAKITEADRRAEALRAALAPFAAFGDMLPGMDDGQQITTFHTPPGRPSITVADLRRAARALSGKAPKPEDKP